MNSDLSVNTAVVTASDENNYQYVGRVTEIAADSVIVQIVAFDGSRLLSHESIELPAEKVIPLATLGDQTELQSGVTAFIQGPAGNVVGYLIEHMPEGDWKNAQGDSRPETMCAVRVYWILTDGNLVGVNTHADARWLVAAAVLRNAIEDATNAT
jgi:hypothetical protein